MQTPASNPNPQIARISRQTRLPPVIYSIPALIAVFLASVYGATFPGFRSASFDLMCALYVFWVVCLWQIHRVLERETHGTYAVQPGTIIIFSVIAGPGAPVLASMLCEQLLRLLGWLTELIADVLPNSLPIVNSATSLMQQYGTLLAIAIAAGAAVSCQSKWMLCLRSFFESRHESLGRHRSLVSAAVIGIAMVVPGSLSLLSASGFAWQFTGTPEWSGRLAYVSYACCLLAFVPLLWLNWRLQHLLKQAGSPSGPF